MNLYGLIGFPLSHSFSKQYFTDKFEKEGIQGNAYELFPIDSIEKLKPEVLDRYPSLKGLNVTIPYKKQILPYLSDKSNLPLEACNCIKIEDGKLIGFNTDVIGFEQSLSELLLPSHSQALILGTGGAAEAVRFVLKKLSIDFLEVSRKKDGYKICYENLNRDLIETHTLIINTTPLGMYPNDDEFPDLPYQYITPGHYLFDLVYNPAETVFLKKGNAKGAITKNGSDMLVIQAEESWKIWNDSRL